MLYLSISTQLRTVLTWETAFMPPVSLKGDTDAKGRDLERSGGGQRYNTVPQASRQWRTGSSIRSSLNAWDYKRVAILKPRQTRVEVRRRGLERGWVAA